jgi:hypothetical protein
MRFGGNIVGSTLGTILYNKKEWGWGLEISHIFWLDAAVVALFVLPFLYHLEDPQHCSGARDIRKQLADIWSMVQRRTIFLPMGCIAFYNMMQVRGVLSRGRGNLCDVNRAVQAAWVALSATERCPIH